MGLAETRFVTVESYHNCSLQSLMRKSTFTTRHKCQVCLRIKNGLVHIATFPQIQQTEIFHVFMLFLLKENKNWKKKKFKMLPRTYHSTLFLLPMKTSDGCLELSPKVKALLLQAGCALQPLLYQIWQTRFGFWSLNGLNGFLITAKHVRIVLIVLDTVLRLDSQLIFQQSKLQTLKTRCWRQIVSIARCEINMCAWFWIVELTESP